MNKAILIPFAECIPTTLPINNKVLKMAMFIMSGGELPPITVQNTRHGYKVIDGRHRISAYKLLGQASIMAKYSHPKVDGIKADALAVLLGISINEAIEIIKNSNE
jgi:uncharacterized ParB-like nuclease family protein